MAGKFIVRQLRNLRARGARIVVNCHEDEQVDQLTLTKKRGPKVNDALYSMLLSASSDMLRLSLASEPELAPDGTVLIKPGTRILQLGQTELAITKVHVALSRSSKIKARMKDPTMNKLYEHLGKKPTWLVLYGPPGAGKTTLALSEIIMGDK